jgi:hypothetical protein
VAAFRLTADGEHDPTFGSSGWWRVTPEGGSGPPVGLDVATGGGLTVAQGNRLHRLSADGVIEADIPVESGIACRMRPGPGGSHLVAVHLGGNPGTAVAVSRRLADGSADADFGTGGLPTQLAADVRTDRCGLALDPDGSAVVATHDQENEPSGPPAPVTWRGTSTPPGRRIRASGWAASPPSIRPSATRMTSKRSPSRRMDRSSWPVPPPSLRPSPSSPALGPPPTSVKGIFVIDGLGTLYDLTVQPDGNVLAAGLSVGDGMIVLRILP